MKRLFWLVAFICVVALACSTTSASQAQEESRVNVSPTETRNDMVLRWDQLNDRDYMDSVAASDKYVLSLQMDAGDCELIREHLDAAFVGACEIFQEPPDGLVRFEGGSAKFPLSNGTLQVRVDRRADVDGATTATLEASKQRCSTHQLSNGEIVVDCEQVWTRRKQVDATALQLDLSLETATLRVKLRDRRLVVKWRGERTPQFGVGPQEGYVLLQQRDAVAAGRWGAREWAFPEKYSKNKHAGITLYRRLEFPQ